MSNVYHILFQFYQKTLLKLDFYKENVYYINENLETLEKIMAFTTEERYRAYADWHPNILKNKEEYREFSLENKFPYWNTTWTVKWSKWIFLF